MPSQTSDRLKQKTEKIMQLWEERARAEVSASMHQDSLVLQDSLSQYLTQLSHDLSTGIDRTAASLKPDAVESTRNGKSHGQERAGYADYSISQVIFEYHILRQVIFQVLEADAPLDVRDRDIIIGSIEQTVNDAASAFSKTLQDIQELFMVTLTHDLKHAINVVTMGTQLMLRRSEPGDAQMDMATRMMRAIKRLNGMIQNLLDASRLRAGYGLKLELAACRLDLLVQDVVEELRLTYGERFVVVSDAAVKSHCSRKELRRVIENLAVNAVKYGAPDTPITLTLQQTATQISLTVHNEGAPIAPEAQAILFQQFRRATCDEEQTGWGLGLFLAKSMTEAHQGTLVVESAAGRGTSFIVKLPQTAC